MINLNWNWINSKISKYFRCVLTTLPATPFHHQPPPPVSPFRPLSFHRSDRWARARLMTTRSRRLSRDRKGKRWRHAGRKRRCCWRRKITAAAPSVCQTIECRDRIPLPMPMPVVPVIPVPHGGWRRETRLTTLDHKKIHQRERKRERVRRRLARGRGEAKQMQTYSNIPTDSGNIFTLFSCYTEHYFYHIMKFEEQSSLKHCLDCFNFFAS